METKTSSVDTHRIYGKKQNVKKLGKVVEGGNQNFMELWDEEDEVDKKIEQTKTNTDQEIDTTKLERDRERKEKREIKLEFEGWIEKNSENLWNFIGDNVPVIVYKEKGKIAYIYGLKGENCQQLYLSNLRVLSNKIFVELTAEKGIKKCNLVDKRKKSLHTKIKKEDVQTQTKAPKSLSSEQLFGTNQAFETGQIENRPTSFSDFVSQVVETAAERLDSFKDEYF